MALAKRKSAIATPKKYAHLLQATFFKDAPAKLRRCSAKRRAAAENLYAEKIKLLI